ncbi:MAG: helix-turn-helix transcriptional regulator [Gemmatimonadota bacterium]|nr:MAG: helix-turn-helix transcriptional regulator [Gemmatimonadota bacterium]
MPFRVDEGIDGRRGMTRASRQLTRQWKLLTALTEGEHSVADLAAMLETSKATIARDLMTLAEAGVDVSATANGKQRKLYAIKSTDFRTESIDPQLARRRRVDPDTLEPVPEGDVDMLVHAFVNKPANKLAARQSLVRGALFLLIKDHTRDWIGLRRDELLPSAYESWHSVAVRRLCEHGYVERVGVNHSTRYRATAKLVTEFHHHGVLRLVDVLVQVPAALNDRKPRKFVNNNPEKIDHRHLASTNGRSYVEADDDGEPMAMNAANDIVDDEANEIVDALQILAEQINELAESVNARLDAQDAALERIAKWLAPLAE